MRVLRNPPPKSGLHWRGGSNSRRFAEFQQIAAGCMFFTKFRRILWNCDTFSSISARKTTILTDISQTFAELPAKFAIKIVIFSWHFELRAVQKLESNWKTMWGKNLEPTHTTKKSEHVKRVSRNSQKQRDNYSVQKCVNLVDLYESFRTSVHLQTSASIEPRRGLSKFAKN